MNNKNLYCQLVGISSKNMKQSSSIITALKKNIHFSTATDFSISINPTSSIHMIPRRSHSAVDFNFTSVYFVSDKKEDIVTNVKHLLELTAVLGQPTLFWSKVFTLNSQALNTASHEGDMLFGDPRASVNVRLDLSLLSVLMNNPKMSISHVREFDAWLSSSKIGYDITRIETNTSRTRKATFNSKRERDAQDRSIRYGISVLDLGRPIVEVVDAVGARFSIKWDRRTGNISVEDYSGLNFSVYDRSGNPQPNILMRDTINIANLIGNHVELGEIISDFDFKTLSIKNTYFI